MPVTKATYYSRLLLYFILCHSLRRSSGRPRHRSASRPFPQDELKMTSEPQAPGAPAIIFIREVDRDDNIHTPHEDNYFRIKILTEEGRKHADIEIPFLKENENRSALKARTIRPDGSVANFEGKVSKKYLLKGRFEGRAIEGPGKKPSPSRRPGGQYHRVLLPTVDYGEYSSSTALDSE